MSTLDHFAATAAARRTGESPLPDPLVVRSLEFLGGMASAGGWRPEPRLPEVAFAGRSNVGKSSLLNRLVRRRAFARVSRTPGRTREINFFAVNGVFVLADLPGYGYARVAREQSARWGPLIEAYLRRSPTLRGVVQLLDVRRDLSPDDRQMLAFLGDVAVPVLFVVTKTDKLGRTAAAARIAAIARQLGVEPEEVLGFSATTGAGREELAAAIGALVAAPAGEAAR